MDLSHEDNLSVGTAELDTDIQTLATIDLDGKTYLATSTGVNGGLSLWEITDDGAVLRDHMEYPIDPMYGSTNLFTVWTPEGGLPQLSYGVDAAGNLLSVEIANNGTFGATNTQENFVDPGARLVALEVVETAGQQFLYGFVDLPAPQLVGPSGSIAFAQSTTLLQSITVGQTTFLSLVDEATDALVIYRVSEMGDLTETAQIGAQDGLGVNDISQIDTIEAFGKTFILLTSAGSNSLTVLEINEQGQVTARDHIVDNLNTRFDAASCITTIVFDGQVFVIVSGADDGLSVFSLLPNGQLVLRQTLVDQTGLGLDNITTLEAQMVGTELNVFAASQTQAGLSHFTADLADLGLVLQNTDPGGQTLTGSARDDILIALGQDTLQGGAGQDILVADTNQAAQMFGGAGEDIFVLNLPGEGHFIGDFEVGFDKIDLSMIPSLYDLGELVFQTTDNGLRVYWNDLLLVEIESNDGGPLTSDDFYDAVLDSADRMLLPGEGFLVVGGENGDVIIGSDLGDNLSGGSGSDTIWGKDNQDSLDGGGEDDLLGAGDGDDYLYGGDGNDRVWGAWGDDTLRGGDGNDVMGGYYGNDSLDGGAGNDEIWGSYGHDTIYGGSGNDTIGGFEDNDFLHGDDGADLIWGATGQDTIFGGEGNDQISGGAGNDTLWGGNGADVFVFELDHGTDQIEDFTPGEDILHFERTGLSADDITITEGPDGLILTSDAGVIELNGVSLDDFQQEDIIFV